MRRLQICRKIETKFSLESKNKVIDWFTSNQVSVTMSIIGLFFPDILGLIGKMERFHPRIALRWLLDKSLHFLVTSLFDISSKSVLGATIAFFCVVSINLFYMSFPFECGLYSY